MARRALILVVAVNIALLALYAWTATESTTITVDVRGDQLTASANGYHVAMYDDMAAAGYGIGLSLGSAKDRMAYDDAGPPKDSPLAPIGDLAARLRQEPLGTAWREFSVTDPTGHRLLDLPDVNFANVPEHTMMVGAVPETNFNVRATLARGTMPAGILLHARDSENGLLLYVRPEQRDMLWIRVQHGQWEGPITGGFWSKTELSLLQDNLRLLLATQQVALGILLSLMALGWLVSLGLRPIERRRARQHSHSGSLVIARFARQAIVDGVGQAHALRTADEDQTPTPSTNSPASFRPPWDTLAVITLALAATGVAAYIAYFLLEAMPHVQDSVTYLFQARVFALGRLWVPASPFPAAFEQEFIVNFAGRAFGKYPPGHSLMLLPGVLADLPWLINPLQSGITVFVTYLIGREVHGKWTGVVAAALVATSPFFLFMSGSFMAHPTGLLFTSVFLLFLVKTALPPLDKRDRRIWWWTGLPAGLALGFVFLTRPYTAVAIGTPFGLYAAYQVLKYRGAALRRYGPIIAGLLPLVLALFAYNYALTGIFLKTPMELWWPFDKIGFGAGIGISGIHTPAGGLWNTYRNLTELTKGLFGWPAYVTLALALLPFLTLRATRFDKLFLAAVAALIIAHIAWWADGVMYGPRYYYELVSMLALLSARGVVAIADIVGSRKAVGITLAALLVLALVGYNLVYYLPKQWPLYQGYNYVDAGKLHAVQERQIHDAIVFVDLGQWYEWWNYGAVFSANTPTLDGDVVYARDRGGEANRLVIDLYPGRHYYRLSGTTIEELDTNGLRQTPSS